LIDADPQGIFELILKTVVSQGETILIASERYPAALFNASSTIDGYYQAEVNADMPHWAG